jgi:hypothetical protein
MPWSWYARLDGLCDTGLVNAWTKGTGVGGMGQHRTIDQYRYGAIDPISVR